MWSDGHVVQSSQNFFGGFSDQPFSFRLPVTAHGPWRGGPSCVRVGGFALPCSSVVPGPCQPCCQSPVSCCFPMLCCVCWRSATLDGWCVLCSLAWACLAVFAVRAHAHLIPVCPFRTRVTIINQSIWIFGLFTSVSAGVGGVICIVALRGGPGQFLLLAFWASKGGTLADVKAHVGYAKLQNNTWGLGRDP